jgi:hypothetical protein
MKHSSMGMMAALALAASAGTGNAVEVMPREPSSGPSLLTRSVPRKRKSRRRLNVRVAGGNWKGMEYLSYSEHDACTRAAMDAADPLERRFQYWEARADLIAKRRAA